MESRIILRCKNLVHNMILDYARISTDGQSATAKSNNSALPARACTARLRSWVNLTLGTRAVDPLGVDRRLIADRRPSRVIRGGQWRSDNLGLLSGWLPATLASSGQNLTLRTRAERGQPGHRFSSSVAGVKLNAVYLSCGDGRCLYQRWLRMRSVPVLGRLRSNLPGCMSLQDLSKAYRQHVSRRRGGTAVGGVDAGRIEHLRTDWR
jgi:hypothetical protein